MNQQEKKYVQQLELLIQTYRIDYDLCVLCGGPPGEKPNTATMTCADCSETAEEGAPLKLRELEP